MSHVGSRTWPKELPEATPELRKISDDFMAHWLENLRTKPMYRLIENFNHGYSVCNAPGSFKSTLEIGAGLGEHLRYEKRLTKEQLRNYVALELRENIVAELRAACPDIVAHQGDCQGRLDFPDGSFDRILAIHVLEHLPNLPLAIKEMHRLCNKDRGVFSVVIPCEGGLVYNLARRVSAQYQFEKRYKLPYKVFIEREHLSSAEEIMEILDQYFVAVHKEYFPFLIPTTKINLCVGLTLRPRPAPLS